MAYPKKLPFLLSVPHGGIEVPPEGKGLCRLDLPAILKDGDTWAGQLYSLEHRVLAYACFPVARAVVDVNRAPDDRPPLHPDGVVKTRTVDGEPVWHEAQGPSPEQTKRLLNRYYSPYHRLLARLAQNRDILLGLDCHTMLDQAPDRSPNPGERRPLACLSNGGDERGEALGMPLTAPAPLLRALGRALEQRLAKLKEDHGTAILQLNRPFSGGHIIKKHSREGRLPWIQVEFNRSLYLASPPTTALPGKEEMQRVDRLREIFIQALEEVFLTSFYTPS